MIVIPIHTPFLLVKLADLFILLSAGTLSIALYCKVRYCCLRLVIFKLTRLTATQAQNILSTTGIVESGFPVDDLVENYDLKIDEQVNATSVNNQQEIKSTSRRLEI